MQLAGKRGRRGSTTPSWSRTGTCGTRTCRRPPPTFHGAVPALLAVPERRRRQGRAGARGRRRQLRMRPRRRRRHARLTTAISVRRGQVFQPKAIFGRPRAELRWLTRLRRAAGAGDPRPRAGGGGPARGLPRAARSRDPQPQRPAAGRQQPAPVLDPARPDRRGPGLADSTGRSCSSPTAAFASSTRSCGPPGSARRCRSSTRRCCDWDGGVPLRVAGLTVRWGCSVSTSSGWPPRAARSCPSNRPRPNWWPSSSRSGSRTRSWGCPPTWPPGRSRTIASTSSVRFGRSRWTARSRRSLGWRDAGRQGAGLPLDASLIDA